jgi:hypothetical protein
MYKTVQAGLRRGKQPDSQLLEAVIGKCNTSQAEQVHEQTGQACVVPGSMVPGPRLRMQVSNCTG